MTVEHLRRILSDLPEGAGDWPVVIPTLQSVSGEMMGQEVCSVYQSTMIACTSPVRVVYSSATGIEKEHGRTVLALGAR
jgi:hypothetical protein